MLNASAQAEGTFAYIRIKLYRPLLFTFIPVKICILCLHLNNLQSQKKYGVIFGLIDLNQPDDLKAIPSDINDPQGLMHC